MSDSASLALNCLYCMVPIAIGGVAVYGVWKMNKAKKAPISDDECVACGSEDLTSLGENAYRCNMCGYEGGSGLAKMQDDAHVARIAAMGDEEKRRSGISDLREARTILKAAEGTLSHATALSVMDLAGPGAGDRGQAKQSELVSAVTEIMQAQTHIRDAALKLGHNDSYEFDIDFDSTTFGLDVAFDSMIAGVMVHAKIEEAKGHCKKMLAAVEEALETIRLEGDPSGEG